MRALKIVGSFAKIKPLKISAVTTEKGIKLTSQTESVSYEITNALEGLMGSLAACEIAAIKALTQESKFKVNKVNFKKIESQYNMDKFKLGGKENKIDDIVLEAEFDTNGTQAELDELQKKVHQSCPMYNIITSAGIKVNSTWKNVSKFSTQKSEKNKEVVQQGNQSNENKNKQQKSPNQEKGQKDKEQSDKNSKKDSQNKPRNKDNKDK